MGISAAIAGSAAIGYLGSQSAADKQAGAVNAANATQLSMFGVQQSNLKPYLQAGNTALGDIQSNMTNWNKPFTMDQFHADPGYQFNLEQGQKAIQGSAAASSGLVNAGTLASLSNYSQKSSDNAYQGAFDRYRSQISDSYNRLFGVANMGQTAASGVNSAGQSAAGNISSNTIGAGNAAASGIVGQSNALTGAIGQGIQQQQYSSFLDKRFPGSSTVSATPAPGANYPQFSTNSEGMVSGLYD